ncbi:hypothetical protein NKR23_g6894 [Pleurostoma richardsiae]|uniref:Uncharacterized protein n=1 Tax=Pleurostoma richardsiae TaxID=41990 RepID=A0AA38RXU5_9PEZI|nr:hypothetical protein NKR23_g6894 [Pleurostoma richardsiae]
MGIDDLFGFDDAAYRGKAVHLSIPELKNREVEKIRQILASSCSLGLSIGTTPATAGASLGFSVLAARKMQIAKEKLAIIQAELMRRNVPLHIKLTKTDRIVPVIGGVVGMVAGGLADVGFGSVGSSSMPEMIGDVEAHGTATSTIAGLVVTNTIGNSVAVSCRRMMEFFERRTRDKPSS